MDEYRRPKTLSQLEMENAKLRELAIGEYWCSCNETCTTDDGVCPLYDIGEPDRCREGRLIRELGIEVD